MKPIWITALVVFCVNFQLYCQTDSAAAESIRRIDSLVAIINPSERMPFTHLDTVVYKELDLFLSNRDSIQSVAIHTLQKQILDSESMIAKIELAIQNLIRIDKYAAYEFLIQRLDQRTFNDRMPGPFDLLVSPCYHALFLAKINQFNLDYLILTPNFLNKFNSVQSAYDGKTTSDLLITLLDKASICQAEQISSSRALNSSGQKTLNYILAKLDR